MNDLKTDVVDRTNYTWNLQQNFLVNNFENFSLKIQDVVNRVLLVFKLINLDPQIEFIESSEDLPRKEYEKLKRIVDIIIKQATIDLQFAIPCASVCSAFKDLDSQLSSNADKKVHKITFKEIISHKCLIIINSTAWDEDAMTEHKYLVAKCRFICELLKQNVLSLDIITLCIQNLLNKSYDVHIIEFVCNILLVLENELNQEQNITQMSKIYDKLRELQLYLYNHEISDHVNSMVENVIKLGCNKWIRENTVPFELSSNDGAIINGENIEECNSNKLIMNTDCVKHLSNSSKMKTTNIFNNTKKKYNLNTIDDVEFLKIIQSIVNKITVVNMDKLLLSVRLLPFNSYYRLNKTADIIVDQAKKDLRFALPFAKLCSTLKYVQGVPVSTGNVLLKTYLKDLIISKCLDVFNMEYIETTNESENIDYCNNSMTNNEYFDKLKETYDNFKNNIVATCRFMVELYKHNYMHLNVIYQCVITLLQMNTEEAVLCLCIILSFTGKYLIQNYNIRNIYEQLEHFVLNRNMFGLSKLILARKVLSMRNNKSENCISYEEKPLFKSVDKCPVSGTFRKTNVKDDEKPPTSTNTLNILGNFWISKRVEAKICGNVTFTHLYNLKGVELENEIKSILNKGTMKKIKYLSKYIKRFNLYSMDSLTRCVNIIVDQAVHCPFYCTFYAELCKAISKRKAPIKSLMRQSCKDYNDGKNAEIRRNHVSIQELIVHKCQEIFDIAYNKIKVINGQEKSFTECVKMEYDGFQQQDDDRLQIKKKMLANCKFLMALYKNNFLTINIMFKILETLMLKTYEEFLECSCHIILCAGPELIQNCDVNAIYNQLKELISKNGTSTSQETIRMMDRIPSYINQWLFYSKMDKKQLNKIKKKMPGLYNYNFNDL